MPDESNLESGPQMVAYVIMNRSSYSAHDIQLIRHVIASRLSANRRDETYRNN